MSDEQTRDQVDDAEFVDEEMDAEATDGEMTLEEQLAAAEAEAARNLDGWQRTQAEFANARKRFEKQRMETYGNVSADLVAKLLPLIDDFERAIENAPAATKNDPWFSGIVLIHRKMLSILDEMNVEVIPAVGEPFDPNLHEALSQEPSDDYESGTVSREMRRGYRLGDRVIRPSLVFVAE